ncbi:MAG: transaldolase [Polyangiaceae bacterium UTPRO1]|nr:bifunctional transaldolase/phosoglucose isomerase [Myxococcales bacterium]OQY65596.1 MAG: transaldolase [Polyangiaceae bacterium UTPRO1]
MANPLVELQHLGQSPWHDNISRDLLTSGKLAKMVAAGDITGLTSNPTIFEHAVARSKDYDDAIRVLARKGKNAEDIFDALAIEDIRAAADVFAPVYARSGGADGYASIEVAPKFATDTEATIKEAHRLWKAVARPNLMVKIPATREGVPAIARCIADGLNINVTLIFSLERYDEVMDAYLAGLEKRLAARKPIARIASVASFFVSRVDTAVDAQLERKIGEAGPDQQAQLRQLVGKAGIANAKLAYAAFRRKFAGARWTALAAQGARLQRPLWASTSTKNPAYPDTYYVEALIGPDTVDTLPPATIAAYKDHGKPAPRLAEGLDEAAAILQRIEDAGISMAAVTHKLEVDGVAAFAKSFESLIAVVSASREAFLLTDLTMAKLGSSNRAVQATLAAMDAARLPERLWKQDPTLWKADDPTHQAEIAARMGWLDVADLMLGKVDELTAFADEVRAAGFTRAVLCGMGGSSLAPEVLRRTFGVAKGHVDVQVLDSTDPAAVAARERWSDPAKTLYIVSSKSGSTTEPNVFFQYFYDRVRKAHGDQAGRHFVAITDPGTAMEARARAHGFRRVFLARPEIGGRYSALSHFGLVPAALMGIDVAKLLQRAKRMMLACGPTIPAARNPGLYLGAVIGALAKAGRDKLTFIVDRKVDTFGYWLEQLIAESTGKEGTGVVPVEGEPVGRPDAYGRDRVFAYIRLDGSQERAVQSLARAGHPVVAFRLKDAYDLGGEFLRWEIATAAAGWVLGIDPFDQPNVQESKDNTVRLLQVYRDSGALPDPGGVVSVNATDFARRLEAHLKLVRKGDYIAVTAYVERTGEREQILRQIRAALRDRSRNATTVGYGPRFLHSTGQLHKGGAANGVFIQLSAEPGEDLAIPGEAFSFATLEAAQALGDYQSLAARGRRVLRVSLGVDVDLGLRTILAVVGGSAPKRRRTTVKKKPAAPKTKTKTKPVRPQPAKTRRPTPKTKSARRRTRARRGR